MTTPADRAHQHAALGDPIRLEIAEDLARSDRSPSEIMARFDLRSNALAYHLGILEGAGLIRRVVSEGDARRRYLKANRSALADLGVTAPPPSSPILFVCTHNSARSQMAAEIWQTTTGDPASSAGTEPSDAIHPGAVGAARRNGLDLSKSTPQMLEPEMAEASQVITVCDRAHESLEPAGSAWHWSIPDPVRAGDPQAFDDAFHEIANRIRTVTGS